MQADLENDGACVQIRSSSAVATTLERNWASESAKGFRLDSGSNDAFCPGEVNNTIRANVALRTNGFELKNDYNTYAHNLALWGPPFALHGSAAGGPNGSVFRVDNQRFKAENSHSKLEGNVATSWLTPVAGVVNRSCPDVLAASVGAQLHDPLNFDFRPRGGSDVARYGAGPYDRAETEAGEAACAAGGARYWIPGRRGARPSTPIPPNGTTSAAPDAALMWLAALGSETATHRVFLAPSRAALRATMRPVATLPDGCNVQNATHAGGQGLAAGSTWWWRVDSGGVRGDEWTFTVREA